MSDSNSTPAVISASCFIWPNMKPITASCFLLKMALLVPLSVWILHLGYCQRQRSSRKTLSHSDFFTYHMALIELAGCVGGNVFLCGILAGIEHTTQVGIMLGSVIFPGELLIHSLTCVDRYLAVVHPIIYLELRQKKGIVARNASVAVVWILSLSSIGFTYLYYPQMPEREYLSLLAASLAVVSFCSASVLRALIRPGPGDAHNHKAKTDQLKLRAFKIIVAILLVQLLWLLGILIVLSLRKASVMDLEKECLLLVSVTWFNIPCSLALPVLFLQRKISKS